jgi:catechol-2,3-dioxygenase
MQIHELRLKTADLNLQRDFYARSLRLPIVSQRTHSLTIQVGRSILVFEQEDGWQGRYHFAFNVPENQFSAAKAWITQRTSLARLNEDDEFHSAGWNADMLYFYDAAGNILELIARHTLSNASETPFTENSLLSISEIGLATDDVERTVGDLCRSLNVPVYDGQGSDSFTAVGDEDGLIIVVKRGRVWYPETGVHADLYPVTVTLLDEIARVCVLPGLPYDIRSIHERSPLSAFV